MNRRVVFSCRLFSTVPPAPPNAPIPFPSSSSDSYVDRLQKSAQVLVDRISATPSARDIRDLLEEMQKRNYAWWRWAIGGCFCVGYLLLDVIKAFTANQAAEVTKKYLENEQFKKVRIAFWFCPVTFFFSMLGEKDIVAFVTSKEIESALTDLIGQVLKEKIVEEQLTLLAKQLLQEEIVEQQLKLLLSQLLNDPKLQVEAVQD